MSLNLSGGTVSIEDGDKSADKADQYDVSRKVRVELEFIVGEDSSGQAELDAAAAAASAKVNELLGRGPATAQAVTATRTRRTKEQIAADKAAEEAAKQGTPGEPVASPGVEQTASTTAADPTALEDVEIPPQSSAGSEAKPAPSQDPAALDDFTIEPEAPTVDVSGQIAPVSDGDLNSAVQKRNGELNHADGTKKIRELIASYNPDPTKVFQLREIPADRRSEFLTKLNAITLG